jgi:hypothetical protein
MISFSHIVNPVPAGEESDLFTAQPITFATMRAARDFSRDIAGADVRLYAVQLAGEEEVRVPAVFQRLPGLSRSVGDLKEFATRRKLPLIRDILQALYEADDADYMIYTNADIALQPNFYWTAARMIERGHDAFAVNRRTIPAHYRDTGAIPLMYAELGQEHKGWDCFVFPRAMYPRFRLGLACIGAGWLGRVLLTNMACLAAHFRVFTDLHLTFHVGNETAWRAQRFSDYLAHNRAEWHRVFLEFARERGPFDRGAIPGCFLDFFERQAARESRK